MGQRHISFDSLCDVFVNSVPLRNNYHARDLDDGMAVSSTDRGCTVEFPWSRGTRGLVHLPLSAGRRGSHGRVA